MNVERKNAKDDLRLYMPEVIGMLKREGKFPAMHVYACTLRSYEKFCAEERYPKIPLLPCPCRRFLPLRG